MAQVSIANDTHMKKMNKIQAKWKRKLNNRRMQKQSAVLDLAATSSFWQEQDAHIKTGVTSNKVVMMPTGNTANATEKGLLQNRGLNTKARELDILLELKHNSLLSVRKL